MELKLSKLQKEILADPVYVQEGPDVLCRGWTGTRWVLGAHRLRATEIPGLYEEGALAFTLDVIVDFFGRVCAIPNGLVYPCTGGTDIRGTHIFAGDIVKAADQEETLLGIVMQKDFQSGPWIVRTRPLEAVPPRDWMPLDSHPWEVMGNVVENGPMYARWEGKFWQEAS